MSKSTTAKTKKSDKVALKKLNTQLKNITKEKRKIISSLSKLEKQEAKLLAQSSKLSSACACN